MKVIYTCILGSIYDDLKEPTVTSEGWRYVCFTDQPLTSNVWEIRKVIVPGNDPQRYARELKITAFQQWQYSIWLDASFQINMDLNKLWDNYFKTPFTAPRHPLRHCVYHEIDSCIANGRGDARQLIAQKEAYKAAGIPHHGNNIITSGLLMRENTPGCIELCNEWLAELQRYSVRDQVAFGRVSIGKEFCTINWDYSQSKELKYFKHKHLQ